MDRTENTQGVETSGEETGTSTEPRTYTEEEHKAEVVKARSDALAEVGRLKKAADDAVEAVKKANTRITQIQRESDEAEMEARKDEPEAISAIRERQKRRDAEAKLADVEQELDDKKGKLKLLDEKDAEYTKERNAREIATRLNVDAGRLAKLAKFTDGSMEAIEDIAGDLPKKGEPQILKPDSSVTVGVSGGKKPSFEELQAATAQEYAENVKSGAWKL